MICIKCKKDKPENEFDVLNKEIYGGNGNYRCKRCHSCRELMKKNKVLKNEQEYSICPKCKNKFLKEYDKKNKHPYVHCRACRVRHTKEQVKSSKKIYSETIKKSGASLLTNLDKIDKNELLDKIASKIAEKILNRI